VDLAAVRPRHHTLPWVDSVSVQRAWPRGLNVLVIEQTAAARWGERGLLNTRGELFDTDERHIPPELAQLAGPTARSHWWRSAIWPRKDVSRRRACAYRMRLACTRRLGIRSCQRVTVRLGRRQVDERFEKFMNTALKLVRSAARTLPTWICVTTNGFAIGWRGMRRRRGPGTVATMLKRATEI